MIDFQSATWHTLRKFAEERLAAARLKNDDVSLNPEETAAVRGEIRVWKQVLSMPETERAMLSTLPVNEDS